jgi:catechol 2,3-dioxygenase-like lactoylglutathione lyase family enzyme
MARQADPTPNRIGARQHATSLARSTMIPDAGGRCTTTVPPFRESAMKVKRIVPNVAAPRPAAAGAFYRDILGLDLVMDQGWIMTFAADGSASRPQISIASEGGSGTTVPDLSIEVDDVYEALRRVAAAGLAVEYGPTREPWGVTRFYVRDPFGRLVNILAHD